MATLVFATASVVAVVSLHWRKRIRRNEIVVNADTLAAKTAGLTDGGTRSLSVVLDFDRTMSTYWAVGRKHKGKSCHGIVEATRSRELRVKADELNAKYYPIETNPRLSAEEKIPLMVEWYSAINNLLLSDGINKEDVESAVARSGVLLRDGVSQIIDWCGEHHVPLLVFSAGIGDVLQEVLLQRYGLLPPEVIIVSNWMQFDASGRLAGWSSPVLHMFNKNEGRLQDDPIFHPILRRPNVLLVGDSLGDASMADGGAADHAHVLKFGLLNDGIHALLPQYEAIYDVVLLDDAPLYPALEVLRKVSDAEVGRVHALEDSGGVGGAIDGGSILLPPPDVAAITRSDSGGGTLAARIPSFKL